MMSRNALAPGRPALQRWFPCRSQRLSGGAPDVDDGGDGLVLASASAPLIFGMSLVCTCCAQAGEASISACRARKIVVSWFRSRFDDEFRPSHLGVIVPLAVVHAPGLPDEDQVDDRACDAAKDPQTQARQLREDSVSWCQPRSKAFARQSSAISTSMCQRYSSPGSSRGARFTISPR